MVEENVEDEEDLVGEAGAAETGVDVGVRSRSEVESTVSVFIGMFAGIGGIAEVGGI